jgi:DNA-binding CsgD family transcriptional regulator
LPPAQVHNDFVEAGALLGREAELASVDAFIERAQTRWNALVVEGEPGIGKTALWREAIVHAERSGFTVLSCRPAQAEVKLSFAALADLLEPVLDRALDSLPGPQRHALKVALLHEHADGAPAEPRAVAVGLRAVVLHLAASSPVLVAVDDTQWLDASSARALEFAFRRIGGEPVGLLATRRPATRDTRDRLSISSAELIELDRLSLAAIHELLKRRLGSSVPRPLLLRVYETARGNPFFALEIAREVLHTGVRPGDPLPVPKDLRRLLRRRLGRLSPAAREALLAAAAVGEPTRALLAAALDSDPSAGLEEAERAEIVELAGERVRFAHPLYAAAIYAAAPKERRRRLHGRLGEVVAEIEQRARHLALATEAPSQELAAVLDKAADSALQRGALARAAELTELALARTPPADDERRQERVLDLLDRLMLAADSTRARDVARAELPNLTTPRRRVHALLALSDLSYWTTSWTSETEHPVGVATQALNAARGDASLEARCHAVLASYLESDSGAAFWHAQQALDVVEKGADVPAAVQAQALSALTRSKLFAGDGLDVTGLEQAIELEWPAPPRMISDRSSYKLAQWLKYVDDFDGSRRGLQQAHRAALDEGDDFSMVNILINLIILECWAGRWSAAHVLGEELAERFTQLGMAGPGPHVALVAAYTGDAEAVGQLVGSTSWEGIYDVIRLRPLVLLSLSQGDFEAAHLHSRRALELLDEGGMREPAVFRVHADAIESAVRAGNVDEGARVADAFDAHAQQSSIPWNRTAAARSRALVAAAQGDLDRALGVVEVALHEHERLPMPFELARTLLVKGEIERRAKQKSAARASLERARGIFEDLGARLWSKQARAELQRTGMRRTAPDELTESEHRVAELAASGLTNRDVAAQLFMSPKTVEANLSRAYRKLGIRSRAELGARMAGERREPAQR